MLVVPSFSVADTTGHRISESRPTLSAEPLSATALVMLADLHAGTATLAGSVAPVVLAAVALLELVGPLAVQAGLAIAGELPAGRIRR